MGAQLLAWHQVAGVANPQGAEVAAAQPPRSHQHAGATHLVHHPTGPGAAEEHTHPIAAAEVAEVLRWGGQPLLGRCAGAPDLLLTVLRAGHRSQRAQPPSGMGMVGPRPERRIQPWRWSLFWPWL